MCSATMVEQVAERRIEMGIHELLNLITAVSVYTMVVFFDCRHYVYCPECGTLVIHESGCVVCPSCGWFLCS